MSQLQKLRELSQDELHFLAKAVFWLPATAVLLRSYGFRRTVACYERTSAAAAPVSADQEGIVTARKAARMVNIAAAHGFYRARCLEKSLVLIKMLNAGHIPCKLVLGTRREDDDFGAHAWVECEGVVVNDVANIGQHYTTFDADSGNTE